ncbi:hypothetical protein ElyMa_006534800 [Elysia marginata]|uniref:Uncharacterized protein n=1 Tax=Elysia marginata TaxID=1093978 RepID=A0AAV4I7M4_9GAST|nr:hypothetical protein ElyMa_006534800 [Elysia marginata]
MADDSPRKKPGAGLALIRKLMTSTSVDSGASSLASPPGGAGSKRLSLPLGDSSSNKSKWGEVTKRKASLMVLAEPALWPSDKDTRSEIERYGFDPRSSQTKDFKIGISS